MTTLADPKPQTPNPACGDVRTLNERIARTRSLINSLKRAETQLCDRRRLALSGIESQIDALVDQATDSQLDRMMEDLEKAATCCQPTPDPQPTTHEDAERWDGMA